MYSFYLQSEERGTPNKRRSKSEGPHRPNGQVFPVGDTVDAGPAQVQSLTSD